jgi:hypothetical protein
MTVTTKRKIRGEKLEVTFYHDNICDATAYPSLCFGRESCIMKHKQKKME